MLIEYVCHIPVRGFSPSPNDIQIRLVEWNLLMGKLWLEENGADLRDVVMESSRKGEWYALTLLAKGMG